MINKLLFLLAAVVMLPLAAACQGANTAPKAKQAWTNNGSFHLNLDSIKTNQEVKVVSFTIPPGSIDTNKHRHDAYLIGYVLDGEIETKMKDKPAQALKAGDFFYEYPKQVHESLRNLSDDKPAKILLYYLYTKGAVLYAPVKVE